MTYQVLARKWRPRRFQEVIGQEHITSSLLNAIVSKKLGHAYLLTGTRGIGKTTVARLLAKAMRCDELLEDGNSCGQCQGCLDFDANISMNVLEIDGASNNSVDDVREIVNNVHYLPTTGKYKIYIIDEVHMLSMNAFNALLKTLEEPPTHVVFIFATTEAHKLPGTVLSRCQRFDFRNASFLDLKRQVDEIAKSEGIIFENEKIINRLAKMGAGSFRDTLSLFDQVLSFSLDKNISEEIFVKSLGLAKTSSISNLVLSLFAGDVKAVSNNYRQLVQDNILLKNIAHSILDFLFEVIDNIDDDQYLEKELELKIDIVNEMSTPEIMWVFEAMGKDVGWILESISPVNLFEILLQKLTMRREIINFEYGVDHSIKKKEDDPLRDLSKVENYKTKNKIAEKVEGVEEKIKEKVKEIEEIIENGEERKSKVTSSIEKSKASETWEEALESVREESQATAAYLERSNPLGSIKIKDNLVEINLGLPDHEKMMFDHLDDNESKKKIKVLLENAFQKDVNLKFTLLEETERERIQFKTKSEMIEEEEEEKKKMKEEGLKNNKLVLKAEEIFNSKIDKIVLNKNN